MATTARSKNPSHPFGRLLFAAAATAVAAFLLVSLATFSPADPPTHTVYPPNSPVANLCGPVGAWGAYHLVRLLGFASWLVVGAVSLFAVLTLAGKKSSFASLRFVGVLMLAAAVAGLQAMIFPASGRFPELAGGVIGQSAYQELVIRFGPVGTGVWLLLLGGVGAIVAFDKWVFILPAWIVGVGGPATRRAGSVAAAGAAKMGAGWWRVSRR